MFSQRTNSSHISLETENIVGLKKGNMWVNESTREQEGGAGREDWAMLKWAGSERPAVIEGEKQEYKFPTLRCQTHFLSRPAAPHLIFHFIVCGA